MKTLHGWIIALTLLLTLVGIVLIGDVSLIESQVLFSTSTHFVVSQSLWAVCALVVLFVVSKIPTRFLLAVGPIAFFGALCLLVAVLIPHIGVKIAGARRWLSIAGYSLQPAELMKMGMILYLATWLQKPRRFLAFLLLVGGVFGLVLLQPDLGTGLILLSIAAGMYLAAGKPLKHFVWLACIGGLGIGLLILVSPYRLSRLTTFLDPASDPQGSSYHIRQITLALGGGGIFGRGFGNSLQKYRYIPEAATDSIFAIYAEEFGFVGSVAMLSLFALFFIVLSQKVSMFEEHGSEYLIGCGVLSWIGAQILVNMSSVVALLPMTGVPLPFLSYGGSALVSLCIGIGVILGLDHHTVQKKRMRRI